MYTISFNEPVCAATDQLWPATGWKINFSEAHLKQVALKFRNLPELLLPTMETANMICPIFLITNIMLDHLIEDCISHLNELPASTLAL